MLEKFDRKNSQKPKIEAPRQNTRENSKSTLSTVSRIEFVDNCVWDLVLSFQNESL
jgi:hypothetical protein